MTKESFNINGENLLKKIKELIEEGNVRKVTITDKSGRERCRSRLQSALWVSWWRLC